MKFSSFVAILISLLGTTFAAEGEELPKCTIRDDVRAFPISKFITPNETYHILYRSDAEEGEFTCITDKTGKSDSGRLSLQRIQNSKSKGKEIIDYTVSFDKVTTGGGDYGKNRPVMLLHNKDGKLLGYVAAGFDVDDCGVLFYCLNQGDTSRSYVDLVLKGTERPSRDKIFDRYGPCVDSFTETSVKYIRDKDPLSGDECKA